jgi:hypothetical protein
MGRCDSDVGGRSYWVPMGVRGVLLCVALCSPVHATLCPQSRVAIPT